jgi:predicted CoA-binding protein
MDAMEDRVSYYVTSTQFDLSGFFAVPPVNPKYQNKQMFTSLLLQINQKLRQLGVLRSLIKLFVEIANGFATEKTKTIKSAYP